MTSLMVAMTWILIRVFENVMEVLKNGMFINNLKGFLEYEEKIPEDFDGEMPAADFESLEFKMFLFLIRIRKSFTTFLSKSTREKLQPW